MKKKFISVLILLFALSFTGCLNYEQEVSLYPDGHGTIKIHYWMKFQDTTKTNIVKMIGIFNPDTLRKEFTSSQSTVEKAVVYSDTTDSTMHAKIELSFVYIDSLNKTKPFAESNFSLKDGAEGQKVFSQFIPPVATGFGIDGSAFTETYIYDFPGEIITHNATSIVKKKLVWSYKLSELGKGKTISVTYRPYKLKETPLWIFVLSGLVLLVVIIFLFKKKK